MHALVNCLTANDAEDYSETRRHHAEIMPRFEDALAAHADGLLNISALCVAIGVPERTLRACRNEFLGPSRYFLLRRLNMARSALRRADPETATVAEIARNHQFTELGPLLCNLSRPSSVKCRRSHYVARRSNRPDRKYLRCRRGAAHLNERLFIQTRGRTISVSFSIELSADRRSLRIRGCSTPGQPDLRVRFADRDR